MLGKELYKLQVNCELSNERLKSLVFFYEPMIGPNALATYEYMTLKGTSVRFNELNDLLTTLNISVDEFEKQCAKLNEYKLLKTLKKDNQYIFELNAPLTMKSFIQDDLLVRTFILKTSGKYYQELISGLTSDDNYNEFEDISKKFSHDNIKNWSKEDETYLTIKKDDTSYNFGTFFNVNKFLQGVSTNLFPLHLRTPSNLKLIATLADLYNISYDKMKSFIPKISKLNSTSIDTELLKYLCIKTNADYQKVEEGNYNVPCITYLMSLQDGKEVMEYDRKIILKLANEYNLNPSVINVLLEYCLKNCDNRLIEKYVYGVASDLHRNNIENSAQALERLNIHRDNKNIEDSLPKYDDSKNPEVDINRLQEILNKRNK